MVRQPSRRDVAVATGVFVTVLGLLEALRRGGDEVVKTAGQVLAAGNMFAQQTQAAHVLRSSVRRSRALADQLEAAR